MIELIESRIVWMENRLNLESIANFIVNHKSGNQTARHPLHSHSVHCTSVWGDCRRLRPLPLSSPASKHGETSRKNLLVLFSYLRRSTRSVLLSQWYSANLKNGRRENMTSTKTINRSGDATERLTCRFLPGGWWSCRSFSTWSNQFQISSFLHLTTLFGDVGKDVISSGMSLLTNRKTNKCLFISVWCEWKKSQHSVTFQTIQTPWPIRDLTFLCFMQLLCLLLPLLHNHLLVVCVWVFFNLFFYVWEQLLCFSCGLLNFCCAAALTAFSYICMSTSIFCFFPPCSWAELWVWPLFVDPPFTFPPLRLLPPSLPKKPLWH